MSEPTPEWRAALVPAGERPHESGGPRGFAAVDPPLWFVLNLQSSERQDALVLEFWRAAAGARRDLRPVRLRERDLEVMAPPERALLAVLLQRQPTSGEPSKRRDWEQFGHAELGAELASQLLPPLCASGRLLVRENARAQPDALSPLSFDDGAPLDLHLHLLERPKSWLLTATLVQPTDADAGAAAERAFPLARVALVTSDGFVVHEQRMRRIAAVPGVRQWLELLRKQPTVDVPQRDRKALLEFITDYSGQVPLHLPAALRLEEAVGTPTPCLLLRTLESFDRRTVEARLSFEYDGRRVVDAEQPAAWIDDGATRITRRDFAAEQAHRDRLLAVGAEFARLADALAQRLPMDLRLPVTDLLGLLQALAAEHWRIELANRRLRFGMTGEWRIGSGMDWFELDGAASFEGAAVQLPELLRAVRRGESVVTLSDGSSGFIPAAWRARLESIARLGNAADGVLRFGTAQALLLDALLAERVGERSQLTADAAYRRRLTELTAAGKARALDPPASFQGELRPYQREGLGWFEFLQKARIGGCLADDMGLGKTVQVLALLDSRRRAGRPRTSIVVVPKSLVFNWQQEAARFTPELRVLAYVGPLRHSLRRELMRADVVLTTYATLLRDIQHIKDLHFDYAILDEAQAIKNDSSQSAKACRLLVADHRLAMSGTPIENHLGELWSLFEFLNPGLLGSIATFRSLPQLEDSGEVQALQRALKPFVLRRTKGQVLTELPEKVEQTLLCELSAEERGRYDELLAYYRATLLPQVRATGLSGVRMHVLEALLRLRQAALHPGLLDPAARADSSTKFDRLLEQLEELLPEGHKALVFSQFTGLLGLLRERLDALGWQYAYLDGSTRDRQAVVESFQNDPSQRLFLISLRAGGQGLNLTAADYVFILDPWWNPAVEAQAIDRAHRIGQTRAVFAYRLIAVDTIEQKIVELQERKRELAEAIITADSTVQTALTAEDLELLLG